MRFLCETSQNCSSVLLHTCTGGFVRWIVPGPWFVAAVSRLVNLDVNLSIVVDGNSGLWGAEARMSWRGECPDFFPVAIFEWNSRLYLKDKWTTAHLAVVSIVGSEILIAHAEAGVGICCGCRWMKVLTKPIQCDAAVSFKPIRPFTWWWHERISWKETFVVGEAGGWLCT